jgi:hypothetical protein
MSTLLENINVGTTAGDGTGDSLRNAMVKVNHAIDRANVLTHQMNTVSFVGDSITNYGFTYKFGGTGVAFLGSNAPALTDGDGTIEIDTPNMLVRWTAPGDTVGAWTPIVNGIQAIESGTANKWATVYLPVEVLLDSYPNGITEATTITERTTFGYTDKGFQNWFQILSGQRLQMLNALGVIGNTSADALARINQCYEIDINGKPLPEGYGPRIVVIYIGANDMLQNLSVTNAIQNIRDMRDYVVSRGSYAALGTLTDSNAFTQELNKGIRKIAHEDHRTILADFWNAVRDPLSADGDFIDGVGDLHFSNLSAFLAGRELYTRLTPYLNGWGRPSSEFAGDLYNLCRNGAFLGTAGTTSTGVTGNIADDYTIVRTGTVSVVASKENTSYNTPWQVFACTGASNGDSVTMKLNTSAYNTYATLASMGLVVCDKIYADVEFETLSFQDVVSFTVNLKFFDGVDSIIASSNYSADGWEVTMALPPEHNDGILRTPTVCVPSGTTHVSAEITVLFLNGGEGTFKVRALCIKKDEFVNQD